MFFSIYPTVMTSPEFRSVTKLLAMVMMTGSMIYDNEYKCLARYSFFLIVKFSYTIKDLNAPLVGQAGGPPGPHTEEFLSPLERKHFVSHSSLESNKLRSTSMPVTIHLSDVAEGTSG